MSESTDQATAPVTAWDANSPREEGGETSVLLPLGNGAVSGHAVETARTIAIGNDAELVILNAVSVPEQTPLTLPDRRREKHRNDTTRVVETAREGRSSLSVTGRVHVGRRRWRIIVNALETYDIDTIVVDSSWNESRLSPLTRTLLEKVLARANCSVAVPTGAPVPESAGSILVPVAGGPHSGITTDVAGAIARAHDAWIELLHVITVDDPARRDRADRQLSASDSRLMHLDNVDTWVLEADDVAEAIIEQSQYYDVTVIGAPRTPRLRRFLLGSTARTIQKNAPTSLITVWR